MSWSTADELSFLRGLGNYTDQPVKPSRVKLLEGYLAGAEQRTDWTGMIRSNIIANAAAMLAKAREEKQ